MDGHDPNLASEVIKKLLVEGKEMATKLQQILFSEEFCGGGSADELVQKILRSFSDALSVLRSRDQSVVGAGGDEVISSQVEYSACDGGGGGGGGGDDWRSENSGVSLKRPAAGKGVTKRGCYKRKKSSFSYSKISATIEDDHAWRKYGQKDILNSTHPRSYFRCTHKFDQGCKATKQVQKMEEDAQMYRITYIGQHTCREVLKNQEIILNADDTWESNNMLKFGNSEVPLEQDDKGRVLAVKTESKDETLSGLTDNVSSMDSIMWRDIMLDEPAGDTLLGPSLFSSEVTSQSFDMDILVKSINFDQYDFTFDTS